jgi:hypothetical protein
VSLVRTPSRGTPVGVPAQRGPAELRVLHASATEVAGFESLRGDDHAVDLALWGGQPRRTRRVVVDRLSDPASRESLEEALASGPDLVVFTGHSTVEDGRPALILADEQGNPDHLGGSDLAAMLLRAGTPLVVLNACDTASTAGTGVSLTEVLVGSGVETVVGMQMPISDSNAGHFAVGMIGALSEGRSVDIAVALGRRRVAERAGYAEWGIPALVTSSLNADPSVELSEPRMRSATPDLADARRGGGPRAEPENDVAPTRSAQKPPARRRLIAAGLAVVLLVAVGGWWFTTSDDGDDEVQAAATSTTTSGVPGFSDYDPSELRNEGVYNASPLTGSTLADTSPTLVERMDEIERSSSLGLAPANRMGELDISSFDWPSTPATSSYVATNVRSNPECEKLRLSTMTVLGVAGRLWSKDGTTVLITAVQVADRRTAQQYFWATSMHVGFRADQCSGWPVDGIANDPRGLNITRLDIQFEDSIAADELMTAVGADLKLEGISFKSSHQAVARFGTTIVGITVAAIDKPMDTATARTPIAEALQVFDPA